jgi:hypothetical protein
MSKTNPWCLRLTFTVQPYCPQCAEAIRPEQARFLRNLIVCDRCYWASNLRHELLFACVVDPALAGFFFQANGALAWNSRTTKPLNVYEQRDAISRHRYGTDPDGSPLRPEGDATPDPPLASPAPSPTADAPTK